MSKAFDGLVDKLYCPMCDFDHTHFTGGLTVDGENVSLLYRCESGHTFELLLLQHKGATDVRYGWETPNV